MSLKEYQKKRSFNKTPEPSGVEKSPSKKPNRGALFVIQKHAASHLHYDFRLEHNGVLKSWAVPKGPCLDPTEKRLAVEVEDHPLSYATFEGRIPKGQYGAGEVIVWDEGVWSSEMNINKALRSGKLEFTLQGKKLRGAWLLLRLKGKPDESRHNWLLVKRHDDFAKPLADGDIIFDETLSVKSGRAIDDKHPNRTPSAPKVSKSLIARKKKVLAAKLPHLKSSVKKNLKLPSGIKPQLAIERKYVPSGENWIYEIKLDGYRMLCYLENGHAKLMSRNQLDWTHRYEEVIADVKAAPLQSSIMDGEIVALLPNGISSFQALQNSQQQKTKLAYFVFDLLMIDGHDLRPLPLIERKRALKEVVAMIGSDQIRYSDHYTGSGQNFLTHCCQHGLEGLIAKRADQPYRSARSADWVKVKCSKREELVIGGFSMSPSIPKGFGALLVGFYDGEDFIYCGRVGTGFNSSTYQRLRAQLEPLVVKACPFTKPPPSQKKEVVRWTKPMLVAEIAFTSWTDDAILRHASFQGLREDKPTESVTRPSSFPSSSKASAAMKKTSKKSTRKIQKKTALLPSSISFNFTHPERVLFPDIGLTKFGLAEYYATVSSWILPHILHKPLSLLRCPEGLSGSCFYQKHAVAGTPKELGRITISEKEGKGEYVVVENVAGLLGLVQMSILEIHPWGSLKDKLEFPNRLIFDLDPDPKLPWDAVIEGALDVQNLLHDHYLESFVKTTGGKGLHVEVPLFPRKINWKEAKLFCRTIALALVRRKPKLYTASMSKRDRTNKIFIDYFRNDRGSTAVAPYSTRAKNGAPVAVPISWEELITGIRSDHFTVNTVPERLANLKQDPWDGFFDLKQTVKKTSFKS